MTQSLAQQVHAVFGDPEGSKAAKAWNVVILGAILASVVSFLLASVREYQDVLNPYACADKIYRSEGADVWRGGERWEGAVLPEESELAAEEVLFIIGNATTTDYCEPTATVVLQQTEAVCIVLFTVRTLYYQKKNLIFLTRQHGHTHTRTHAHH
jgi:hypothetical protein